MNLDRRTRGKSTRHGRLRRSLLAVLMLGAGLVTFASTPAQTTPSTDGNPNLDPSCGINITMILDNSGSINASEAELVRESAQAFASALVGTPSRLKTVVFSTRAQGVSSTGSLTYNLDNIEFRDPALYTAPTSGAGSGNTNWDDALEVARRSKGGPGELVVFITDGDPTQHNRVSPDGHLNNGSHATANSSPANLNNAIVESDLLKTMDTHLFGIGIGLTSADSEARLRAVTGDERMTITDGVPTPPFGQSDYIITNDFDELGGVVSAFVRELCGHTLNVNKYLQKADGTTVKASSTNPWEFTASFESGEAPDTWQNPVRPNGSTSGSLTSNGNGGVSFVWDQGSNDHDHVATLTETPQPGWVYNGAVCSINDFSGNPPVEILNTVGSNTAGSSKDIADLAALPIASHKALNCDVYNREVRTSNISVAKVTSPVNTPGEFDFTLSRGATPIGTMSGLAHGESDTFGEVTPGTYSITESPEPGFDNTSALCDNLNTQAIETASATSLIVGENEHWLCTFTNTARNGSITVVKNASGANGTFGFTSTVPGLGNFSLTTTGDASGGTASTSTASVPVGHYSVLETTPPQWTLTSATCSDGSSPTDIQIGPGEDVICTFNNTADLPSIRVVKTAGVSSILELGGPVTYTVSVINTSVEPVTITELTDSVDGGFPSDITELSDTITATNCDDLLGSTLPVGGSSTCSFTAIVSGPGNTTVTDVVTARAEDADGNEATAQDDAAVNIVGVLPEIAVTKTPSVNSIMEPGGPVTYTVTVTNTGVEPVTLDTFTDTMESDPPVDITVVDGPITATDCNTLVGVTIDVDETVSCTYTYMHHGHVNQFEDGYINDTVTVTGHDDDGTVTATADAKVALLDAPPVIAVTKSANPTSVPETAPGQTREITFTVNVTNLSVEDVTITSLVDSVEGGPAVPIGGTCAALIGTVLVPDQTVSCTFTGLVAGDFGDVVHDTVTATAVDDEQNIAKDSDDAEVSFTDVASSVEVTKTANPTVMNENGGPVTYSVVIRNTSPTDSLKIATITDQIGDNPPFALNGECGALVGFELAPGEMVGCSFTLPVTGNAGTVVTDIVKVTATDDDGGRVSDDDDATVTIVDLPSKLTVTKTAEVDTVDEPGGPVTYRVMISNDSEVDLITIDAIVDSVDGAPAQPVTSPSCVALLGTILAPGDSTSCTFEMTVTGNAGDEVHDVVTVYGTDDDGNPVSDEDPEVVGIVDVPPTGTVTKTASPSTLPETGGTVTFTVIATNTSPDESVTVTALTDEIGGVTYDLTSPNGPITATTCVLGTVLAPAESYSCEFDVAIPAGNAGDVVSDIVRVTLTDDEGNPVTPSDPEEVILTDVAPSIEVTKDNTPDTLPAPGGPVKFEVTVTNTSEEAVTLTSLTDSVEGAPPVDITTVAGSISATTCELGIEIVAGDSYSCSFTMLVSSDEPAEITDVVSASAIDDDGTSVTDTDDALTTITGSADLSIDKELLSKGLEPGKQGSYRLTVTNNGPSTALNPVVVDTLPKGVTPLEASAEGWDCSVAGQITTCERASLASGQSSVITLSVQVDESAAGQTITNVAKVGSDTEDPDPNNNRDEETTAVPQAPPSDNTEDREHPSEEDQGILPVTGSDVLPIVAAGLVLVAMGGGFIGLRRRVWPINQ